MYVPADEKHQRLQTLQPQDPLDEAKEGSAGFHGMTARYNPASTMDSAKTGGR